MKIKSILQIILFTIVLTGCAVDTQIGTEKQEILAISKSEQVLSNTNNSGSEVILDYAKAWDTGVAWHTTFLGLKIVINLENIAYDKEVKVHVTDHTYGQDTVLSAIYLNSADNNREIWTVHDYSLPTNVEISFYIEYKVNGQTFIDNNNGSNYTLDTSGQSTLNDYILNTCSIKTTEFYGSNYSKYGGDQANFIANFILKNIAYEKIVTVVYTTDNWNTVKTGQAVYKESIPGNLEIWTFRDDFIPLEATEIEFAVEYKVNGQSYWDNNYGSNYKIVF